MKTDNNILKKIILFIVTSGVCALVVVTLYSMEPEEKVAEKEDSTPKIVTVTNVRQGAHSSVVKVFGESSPKWETSVRSQVAGELSYISKNLQPGYRVRKGEKLAVVDKADYMLQAAEANLRLENAKLAYLSEMHKSKQARADWNRSGLSGEPDSPLVFHEPQLKSALAEIKAAERNVEKAVRDLQNTTIKAPFNGVVVKRNISKGGVLFSGDEIVTLISDKDVEIRVGLDSKQEAAVGNWEEASVSITNSVNGQNWDAKVVRVGSYLDSKTRLRDYYIKAIGEIPAGMLATVYINGKVRDKLFAVDESSITREGYLWYVDADSKLRRLKPEILFYKDSKIYISSEGMPDSLMVVRTPVQSNVEGEPVEAVMGGQK